MTVDGTASPPAVRRITGFTGILWFVGIVMAIVMIASALGRLVDRIEPEPAPPAISSASPDADPVDGDAGVYAGSGTAQLMLPDALLGQPVVVVRTGGEQDAMLEVGDDAADPDGYRRFAGTLLPEGVEGGTVVALYERTTLWVVAEGDWAVSVEPLVTDLVAEPSVSGTGAAVVLVPGTAAEAIATTSGEGVFWIDVHSVDGYEIAVTADAGDPPIRFGWQSSPYVLLDVYSRDGTEWTITVVGGSG